MEPTQHERQVPRTPSAPADGARQRRGRGQVRAIARAAGRSCSRPGCETPAGATLVFSYSEQVARLVELLDEGEPQAYDLCPAHADRTRPPVGWELSDTRPLRSDSPRRLDDDETVAVLAAALRGETPPTRVDVLEGGRADDPDPGDTGGDGIDEQLASEGEEDPLRAALEELQRVATPDDDVAAQPVAAMPLRSSRPDSPAPQAPAADLSWTDLDLAADDAPVVDTSTRTAQDDAHHDPDDDLTLW